MYVNDMNIYDGNLESELIERAHLAEIERALREREEETKRQLLELEEIVLNQPNDFAD